MNVVFFGSSAYVIPILEVLQKNFILALVVTTEKSKNSPLLAFCLKNKIPYLSLKQFNNSTIQQLQELKSPVAVLADFGLIIPPAILNVFPKGIFNIHPSLLPKYRGPTPVQAAILNGDKTTGISIIKLDEEIDHGPILTQTAEKILETDTAQSLYERLFRLGASLLVQTLKLYLKGKITPYQQDHAKATFTKRLTRQDGYIEISNLKLERKIRAYYPWPGVWTELRIKNPASPAGGKELRIKFLPGQKLQVEGKKPMSYKDFLNGYPNLKQIHTLLKNL